jgi:hypothetical protein
MERYYLYVITTLIHYLIHTWYLPHLPYIRRAGGGEQIAKCQSSRWFVLCTVYCVVST